MIRTLSLLIALCTLLTVGGVYATWVYITGDNIDVADDTEYFGLNLTGVAFNDGYGAYTFDTSTLKLTIDPAAGTTHETALYIEGELVIIFTPNLYAPVDVKNNAVPSTYQFRLSESNWEYEGQKILTLAHNEAEPVHWTKQDNGTFTMTFDAATLAQHLRLTPITLDTKAKYDTYNTVLSGCEIGITISDGNTSSNP